MKKMIVLLPLLGLAACSSPQPTQYQYSQYQCGEVMLAVTYDPQADMVQFPYGGLYYKLDRVESQSGEKYSDRVTTFMKQDKQATLVQKNVTQLTCTLQ